MNSFVYANFMRTVLAVGVFHVAEQARSIADNLRTLRIIEEHRSDREKLLKSISNRSVTV